MTGFDIPAQDDNLNLAAFTIGCCRQGGIEFENIGGMQSADAVISCLCPLHAA
jgi:hypothetical protein